MIPKALSNLIFKSIVHKTIQHLNTIKYADSRGKIRNIYDEISHDYVLGAPFTLHASNPEIMAGVWSLVRETLIVNGKVNRITKEAIAGGVSLSNHCPYCEEAHINMSGGQTDKEQTRLFEWSKSHYDSQSKIIQNPPFTIVEAPEVIGTALSFHYINRMVEVFVTDYPLPLPRFLHWLKPFISSVFKLTAAKKITNINVEPGKSLKRLPVDPLTEEFSWAKSNTYIRKCFTGFDRIISQHGENAIPFKTRDTVNKFLTTWIEIVPGFGNKWIEDATKDLITSNKKIAEFILLIVAQPYKITEYHINELKKEGVKDKELIAIASWASWQATKKIGSWIGTPFSNKPFSNKK